MKTIKRNGKSWMTLGALGLSALTMVGTPLLTNMAQAAEKPAAQQRKPGQPGQRPGGRRGGPMQGMMDKLKLTATQKNKLKAIGDKSRPKMEAIRKDTKLTETQKRAKMRTLRESDMKQMRAVLDAKQKKQFDEMVKQMQQRRGQNGGPRAGAKR